MPVQLRPPPTLEREYMDIEKAKTLSALVERRNRYEVILEEMQSGYTDEWEFRNSHTGTTVDFSVDDWAEINQMIKREFDELTKRIEKLN